MERGRTGVGVQHARFLAEAEILADNPGITDIEMVEALKKKGIETTRQTVHADRKNDLESMTLKDIKDNKSSLINALDELINVIYVKAMDGDMRAVDNYNKLINTKGKLLAVFEQAQLAKQASDRPVINVSIGKPKVFVKEVKKNDKANIE